MSILVTGGAGFIGSHTCEQLLKKGYNVIALDSLNDFYTPELKRENLESIIRTAHALKCKTSFTVIEGDIRDKNLLVNLFSRYKFDVVIHLAAYAGVRPSIADPILYTDVNINGTVNILECMKNYNVKKLLFGSSSSVYGNNKKVPFSESDSVDYPISPYAATKKAGELICHTYHALFGFNVACLRFFTVYGPRQRPDLAIRKFTKLILQGKPIPLYGDGSTQRDYTYIDDIVDGILRALSWVSIEEKHYDVFNLGGNKTVSLKEMIQELEKELGINANLDYQPMQPGDVLRTYADLSHSFETLGYHPKTSFDEGIKKFINWYRETYTA